MRLRAQKYAVTSIKLDKKDWKVDHKTYDSWKVLRRITRIFTKYVFQLGIKVHWLYAKIEWKIKIYQFGHQYNLNNI